MAKGRNHGCFAASLMSDRHYSLNFVTAERLSGTRYPETCPNEKKPHLNVRLGHELSS